LFIATLHWCDDTYLSSKEFTIMTQGSSDLNTTVSALQSGVTNIPPEAAITNIDGWAQRLQASNDPDLEQIADNLTQLRNMLSSGNLDGLAIGQLLTQLGSQTSSAASKADVSAQSQLQELGRLLSQAGSQLSGS
jgi:hypothetical protein